MRLSLVGIAALVAAGVTLQAGQDVRPSVYTAEQAARGKTAIATNAFGVCSDCHADGLAGRVGDSHERPLVQSLQPELQKQIANNRGKVPDLVGAAFRERWGSRSTTDLTKNFEQRFAFKLGEEMRLDLIAYVLAENGYQAGSEPLTMATDVPLRLLSDRKQ